MADLSELKHAYCLGLVREARTKADLGIIIETHLGLAQSANLDSAYDLFNAKGQWRKCDLIRSMQDKIDCQDWRAS
jgi:hypothetical protein